MFQNWFLGGYINNNENFLFCFGRKVDKHYLVSLDKLVGCYGCLLVRGIAFGGKLLGPRFLALGLAGVQRLFLFLNGWVFGGVL